MIFEIDLRTEVNPNQFAAGPVAQHLSRQIIAKSGNEHWYYLRRGVFN
jgi:hypothetical protein